MRSLPQLFSIALAVPGGATAVALAEPPPRPADLVILEERVGREGRQVIGVFGREPDPSQPDVWRVRLWDEMKEDLTISTDVVHCSRSAPMRITGLDRKLILRELNPGGAITRQNRLDHMIWWAACHPDQAGRDPAGLGPLARELGYSGTLRESEQVLPAPRR
jgi:hypothetical protein